MEQIEITKDGGNVKRFEFPFVGNCEVDNQKLTRAMWNDKRYCSKVARVQSCKVCLNSKKLT